MISKRIFIITNRIPYPLKDGGNLAVMAMIKGYCDAGMEVFLYSMNTSRHYVAVEQLPDFFRTIRFETFDINTDIKIVPSLKNYLLSKQPNQAERFYDEDFEDKLIRLMEQFQPEVIQLESIYLSVYLPKIREHSKAFITTRLHNIEYEIWERLAVESSNTFKRVYLKDLAGRVKKFEMEAWKDSDLLIAITDADAQVVASMGITTPIYVAPFGLEVSKSYPQKEEKWVSYHIGAMDWLPNKEAVTWFLENVWKDLHKEVPDFEFHFAGRNMPASFKKYEGNGVVCAGEVPDAKEFVADKKIVIVPLQAGSGIRVKIMEAIAWGKLVISTSVGIQGINGLEDGKHFLLANTKDEFIEKIKFALEHKEEAGKIAAAGANHIKANYCPKKISLELSEKIVSLL